MQTFSLRGERGELRLTSGFSGVGLALLRRVFVLSFLFDYLQALKHLEGEAYYAAVLALVLEVDCLLVVVDEDLRHKPAAVVEPLCPLWDIFVLYLFRLLAHLRLLLFSIVSFLLRRGSMYPTHRGGLEALFTRVRRREILITRCPSFLCLSAFAYLLATPARHWLLGLGAYAKWQMLSTHRRPAAATLPKPRRG